ncbi:hypothetical protein SprV_0301266100 [Sparganum proliferum]
MAGGHINLPVDGFGVRRSDPQYFPLPFIAGSRHCPHVREVEIVSFLQGVSSDLWQLVASPKGPLMLAYSRVETSSGLARTMLPKPRELLTSLRSFDPQRRQPTISNEHSTRESTCSNICSSNATTTRQLYLLSPQTPPIITPAPSPTTAIIIAFTIIGDRTPDAPRPSISVTPIILATTSATTVMTTISPVPHTSLTTALTTTTPITSIVDSVPSCPHCGRTFIMHIGLVSHLRIHRMGTGAPVPGTSTCTLHICLHSPHCSCTLNHHMSPLDLRQNTAGQTPSSTISSPADTPFTHPSSSLTANAESAPLTQVTIVLFGQLPMAL